MIVIKIKMHIVTMLALLIFIRIFFQKCLSFPESQRVSESAISLVKGLLTDKSSRLVYDGIVAHSFFSDLDIENLKQGQLLVKVKCTCMYSTFSQ